jgi:hypothetical protein
VDYNRVSWSRRWNCVLSTDEVFLCLSCRKEQLACKALTKFPVKMTEDDTFVVSLRSWSDSTSFRKFLNYTVSTTRVYGTSNKDDHDEVQEHCLVSRVEGMKTPRSGYKEIASDLWNTRKTLYCRGNMYGTSCLEIRIPLVTTNWTVHWTYLTVQLEEINLCCETMPQSDL